MMEIVTEARKRCKTVLNDKKLIVQALADELLAKETINS